MAVTGTLKPKSTYAPPEPVIYDITIDYDETSEILYARDDIDHKVYVPSNHDIMGDTKTGQIKAVDNNDYS